MSEDKWKDAVINALVVNEAYKNSHEYNPRLAVADLLIAEIKMAQYFLIEELLKEVQDSATRSILIKKRDA